jgi:hypothetical protein
MYGKIMKMLSIMRSEVSIKLSRCVDNLTICETSLRNQITDILGLCRVITSRRKGNIKAKKIFEGAKIFHLKVLTKELLKLLNTSGIISSDDHVINI